MEELPTMIKMLLHLLLDDFDYHSNKASDRATVARVLAIMVVKLKQLLVKEKVGVSARSPKMTLQKLMGQAEADADRKWVNTLDDFLGEVPFLIEEELSELLVDFDYYNELMSHRVKAMRILSVTLFRLKQSLADARRNAAFFIFPSSEEYEFRSPYRPDESLKAIIKADVKRRRAKRERDRKALKKAKDNTIVPLPRGLL